MVPDSAIVRLAVVSRYPNRVAPLGIKPWPLPAEWDDAALKRAFLQTQVKLPPGQSRGITYDAVLEACKHGVGTITVVNEAANNLLTPRQMNTDARTEVLVAAANLAFVMRDINRPVTLAGSDQNNMD